MSGGDVAATTEVSSGGAETGHRDRDPPPSFDGKEEPFRQHTRELELWRHETDVPKVKQGAKVLRHLSGSAKAVVDELSIAEITSEEGVEKILAALKICFQPHLETAVPHALEKHRARRKGAPGHAEVENALCKVRSHRRFSSEAAFKSSNHQCRQFSWVDYTRSEHGVVDAAAQGGLIGQASLQRLEEAFKRFGLKVLRTNKESQARGIGGKAQVCGVVEIPVGIGGINGLIECTVVEDEVPLLLSIQFLKEVSAVVDLCKNELQLNRFGVGTELHHLRSGHVAVDVVQFDPNGWCLPMDSACAHGSESDCVIHRKPMFATSLFFKSHGVNSAPCQGHSNPQSPSCHEKLARGFGESGRSVDAHGRSGKGRVLERRLYKAVRYTVKKQGPNHGRHFYRCSRSLCDFFLWDPEESNEMKLQQELEEAHKREEQLKAEMQERVNATLLEAERRHNVDAHQQMQACQAQVGHMHQQLIWMTGAAGEERLENLMRDPALTYGGGDWRRSPGSWTRPLGLHYNH
eukprot:s22_g1.t1